MDNHYHHLSPSFHTYFTPTFTDYYPTPPPPPSNYFVPAAAVEEVNVKPLAVLTVQPQPCHPVYGERRVTITVVYVCSRGRLVATPPRPVAVLVVVHIAAAEGRDEEESDHEAQVQ